MTQFKFTIILILSVAFGLALFPKYGHANHLGQVTGTTCSQQTDGLLVEWDDLTGAVKYSVDYMCTMDLGGGLVSVVEFSIGTSERTDGGLMGDSNLFATFVELDAAAAATTGGLITDLTGYNCLVKVKGLDPGNGKGRQNHAFSDPAASCGVLP